ncbi:hypothetical protein GCM10028807_32930 [Spirosoma daeguense]
MPISVRFALRSPKKGDTYTNPHLLEVWITVNGSRVHFGAVWPVGTGAKLLVNPAEWQIKAQRSSRRDDPVNRKITALKAHIESIFERQCVSGVPTVKSVTHEITESIAPVYVKGRGWVYTKHPETVEGFGGLTEESGLQDALLTFIIEMKLKHGPSPKKKEKIKVLRWERGLYLLKTWANVRQRPIPPCCRVTLSWLNEYHEWLIGQQSEKQSKPISAPMASRYIGQIGQVLQWMVEDELLTHNSAKKRTWPRYNDKEISFLEPEHIATLFTLKWKGTKGIALWWFLLMCCTGLDYPDAVEYARNRQQFERVGPAGPKLVGNRMKPPHEAYDVPFLDEVNTLFAKYPTGPRDISGDCVNRYTEHIEDELEIEWRITCKIARKTFGCLMLINGFYIGEVSRMLGHKRISTTEQHYVRVLGSSVDRARLRVGKNSLL